MQNSLDEIVAVYKRNVDRTLIDECLKRTVEERIRALEQFGAFQEELRLATNLAHRTANAKPEKAEPVDSI